MATDGMNGLKQFYVLFNRIFVMSGEWKSGYEVLYNNLIFFYLHLFSFG